VTRLAQRVMHCPCGKPKVLAMGLCSTCYTLKRQDEEYFGGLREAVLERDGYRCRVCDASGRDKRSIIVHHRIPGRSVLNLMLSCALAAMPRFTARKRCFRPCLRSSWNCGVSSILKAMNRSSSTLA
jgi:hypothetical protein